MVRRMPDFETERYDSIDGVIKSLVRIQDTKSDITLQQAFCDTLLRIFAREGIELEINNENIDLIIDKLSDLDEETVNKENEILKESALARDDTEEKISGSAVPVAVLKELVDEYQLYLDNGVEENEALRLVCDKNSGIAARKNIENIIRRQTEIYWENLNRVQNFNAAEEGLVEENASDLEKEIAKTLSEGQLVLEKRIDEEVTGVKAKDLSKRILEDVYIQKVLGKDTGDIKKRIINLAKETKGIEIDQEKQKLLVEIVENTLNSVEIKVEIDRKTEALVEKVTGVFGDDNELRSVIKENKDSIRISVGKMIQRQVDDKSVNTNTEVRITAEEIKKLFKQKNGIELAPSKEVEIETEIKSANIDVERWIQLKNDQVNKYRIEKLSSEIFVKTIRINPSLSAEKREFVKEYGNLISSMYYFRSEADKYKDHAVEKAILKGLGQERVSNAYTEFKGLYSILKMNPGNFNGLLGRYKQLKGAMKGVELPLQIRELRSFEGLMTLISEVPEVKNLVNATQKYLKVYEVVNGFSGGLLDKIGLKKIGTSIVNSVGGQAMEQFVANSLEVFAEKGVKKGVFAILKGILSGGVKAGAAAAETGAAATGGVAGAVAAFQAIPVAGQVVLVAALGYGFLRKFLKPIISITKSIFKSVGVDFDGMKSFFKENFGNFFGGILNFGAKMGILIISIPVAFSAISISIFVGPIIVFLFIGLFFYNMLNGSLLSSLVPPVRLGSGEEQAETIPSSNSDFSGDCSRGSYIVQSRQCDPQWAQSSLPAGCTICKAGCGPTAVSMILQKKDASNNVVSLLTDSLYSGVGCDGSSIDQHASVLRKYLGNGAVTYNAATLACSKTDIANWICDGKIVLVGAKFFNNNGTGGHFFLGVAVDKGEIVSADPYYGTRTPMDGSTSYGHVDLNQDIWCLLVDPSKY